MSVAPIGVFVSRGKNNKAGAARIIPALFSSDPLKNQTEIVGAFLSHFKSVIVTLQIRVGHYGSGAPIDSVKIRMVNYLRRAVLPIRITGNASSRKGLQTKRRVTQLPSPIFSEFNRRLTLLVIVHCLSLLSGWFKYRAHQSARDLPGDTAANALRDGLAGFGVRGGLHVTEQLCHSVEFAAELAEGHSVTFS
jgi:hypothetical protein